MKWHVDSGHAWLQVKISELLSLGIATKISGFSYAKGAYAYLEEDCDAWHYLNAKQLAACEFDERVYKDDAPCRNYNRFCVEAVNV